MRRTFISFLTLVVLWALLATLNDVLAPAHVYLWLGGLFVTYNALALSLRAGIAATFLGGLVCDAGTDVAFGTHALLFAAAHAVIFNVRDRVPREETAGRVVIALLANLALFLVFSFLHIGRVPAPAAVWPRLVFDLLCSQVALVVLAPWFFALQTRALELSAAFSSPAERRGE